MAVIGLNGLNTLGHAGNEVLDPLLWNLVPSLFGGPNKAGKGAVGPLDAPDFVFELIP